MNKPMTFMILCSSFLFSFSMNKSERSVSKEISFKLLNNDPNQYEMKIYAWRNDDEKGKKKITIRHNSLIEVLEENNDYCKAKVTTPNNGTERIWVCTFAKKLIDLSYINQLKTEYVIEEQAIKSLIGFSDYIVRGQD